MAMLTTTASRTTEPQLWAALQQLPAHSTPHCPVAANLDCLSVGIFNFILYYRFFFMVAATRIEHRAHTTGNNKQQTTSLTTNCRQLLMQQIIINVAATASSSTYNVPNSSCFSHHVLFPFSFTLSVIVPSTQFQLKLTDCICSHTHAHIYSCVYVGFYIEYIS